MDNSKTIKLPNKKYGVIYADPPWSFRTYSNKGKDRSPEKHYNVMSLNDICNMPVNDIADENCVLLMWVCDPMLDQALKVIDAWGFKYKTVGFTWAKTNKTNKGFFTGLGYWTRGNPEMCLLATKGKPKRINKDVSQLVIAERGRHSEKPLMHESIERLVDGPYIELFARKKTRPGWDFWGNEV
jgi:N6-adenosine-specific RNA methylase IME4